IIRLRGYLSSLLSLSSLLNLTLPCDFPGPIALSAFLFSICLFLCHALLMNQSLIVHGGAWNIPDEAVDACKSGCHRALAAGWSILAHGGSALDAIEAATMVLEDDSVFDAGCGSH